MPQTYGKILKQLLSLTETKAAVLANDLDYNLSYISKWCNDVKLPSYKNITAINERASFLFGDAIRKSRHEEVFFETFPNIPLHPRPLSVPADWKMPHKPHPTAF